VTDEEAILSNVLTVPEDDARRLVYADWLEERGDYLRATVALERLENEMPPPDQRVSLRRATEIGRLKRHLRDLDHVIDQTWVVRLHRGWIEHCNMIFELRSTRSCPRLWQSLPEGADHLVRHCGQCDRRCGIASLSNKLHKRCDPGIQSC